MKLKIDLIGIVTQNLISMTEFYRNVMGFPIELQLENYVEFKHEGVRFALTTTDVMKKVTSHPSYDEQPRGHKFELAFGPFTSPSDVDKVYGEITSKGATSITPPADMPWNQRTAFFADPDGNIHELFANLPKT
ncbi:MAG: VOC family protein [Candidatus Kariarchaeaceae archaeon]|jgi:catechol 2,3-dioxygenase-like lactoylglutathione lyase family enzyme